MFITTFASSRERLVLLCVFHLVMFIDLHSTGEDMDDSGMLQY